MRIRFLILLLLALPACTRSTPERPQAEDMPPELAALFERLDAPRYDPDNARPALSLRRDVAAPVEATTLAALEPAPEVPAAPPGPLHVLSTTPEGEGDVFGAVRVTFDQPMVPVTALDDLAAMDVPLELTPRPEGRFRWLGTRTLAFEPALGRMPKATEYVARIAAGTRSANGGQLVEDVRFTFATAPLRARVWTDHRSRRTLTPRFVVTFDQRVDVAAMVSALVFRGPHDIPARTVTVTDAPGDRSLRYAVRGLADDRYVIVTPARALRRAADYRLVLPAGARSREGPRPMPADFVHAFETFRPLAVRAIECSGQSCDPEEAVHVDFNEAIAEDQDYGSLVQVTPTLTGMSVERHGARLRVHGQWRPRTRYRVTVLPGLLDVHGQTLGVAHRGTVQIQDFWPSLEVPEAGEMTIERGAPRSLPVRARNIRGLRAAVATVPRDRLVATLAALESGDYGYDDEEPSPFEVATGSRRRWRPVRLPARRNQLHEARVSFASAIRGGASGYALVSLARGDPRDEDTERYTYLIQATDIGLLAHVVDGDLVVRATRLSTGAAVAGAQVRVFASSGDLVATAQTGADGLARVAAEEPDALVVSSGDDEAYLDVFGSALRGGVHGAIYTDRNPYRPGDTVEVHVVARQHGADARQVASSAAGMPVHCEGSGEAFEPTTFAGTLSPYGTFAYSLAVRADATTGEHEVWCRVGTEPPSRRRRRSDMATTVTVADYRPVDIEVEVTPPAGPLLFGATVPVHVSARYLFGAQARGLDALIRSETFPIRFDPPGHDGFVFGQGRGERAGSIERLREFDDEGRLVVEVPTEAEERFAPTRYSLEVAASDLTRFAVAARASFIVHPALAYVGLRVEPAWDAREQHPLEVYAKVVDLEGAALVGRSIRTSLVRVHRSLVPKHTRDGWVMQTEVRREELDHCVRQSEPGAVSCHFVPPAAGRYELRSVSDDADGREIRTTAPLRVGGAAARSWWGEGADSLVLEAARDTFEPGRPAQVRIHAPWPGGRGILTMERAGIVTAQALDMTGTSTVVEVPITAADAPSLTVRATLSRGRVASSELEALLVDVPETERRQVARELGRPAVAEGSVELNVDSSARRMAVQIVADETARPGSEVPVTVQVRSAGEPADAEVSISVVDEGVLALLGFETPDPLPWLRSSLSSRVTSFSSQLDQLAWTYVDDYAGRRPRRRRRRRRGTPRVIQLDEIRIEGVEPFANTLPEPRADFRTTAFHQAGLRTDAEGNVRVDVTLPDDLTRFRIMAVAVARDERAGSAEAGLEVNEPLVLRPALPRFATLGDSFDASVVVHNETGQAAQVAVGVRAAGLRVVGDAYETIHLDAGQAREVVFPVQVERADGDAHVLFGAVVVSEGSAPAAYDAVDLAIPLQPPATAEAFATYGSVTGDAARIPVTLPSSVVQGWGGLELELATSAMGELTEASRWLEQYPWESAENLASRLMGAAAMARLAEGRDAALQARSRATAERIVPKLLRLQSRGGFRRWPEAHVDLYASSWATLALLEARRAGIGVPEAAMEAAMQHLYDDRVHYSVDRRAIERAFVAYVLAAGDRAEDASMQTGRTRLFAARESLPVFARVWLALALEHADAGDARVEELWRTVLGQSLGSARGVRFPEGAFEDGDARVFWHTDRRTDAIVLAGLLAHAPDHAFVERAATELMDARQNGRWATTQENAWVLLAMSRYIAAREATAPDGSLRAWVGGQHAGDFDFGGGTALIEGLVPMASLAGLSSQDLVLEHRGAGRIYYRVGMRHAPTSMRLPAREEGFSLSRAYEAIEDPADVRRDDDGVWHVRAGKSVRVRLTLVVPSERHGVGIQDPLPAGFEAVHMHFLTRSRAQDHDERPNLWADDAIDWWQRLWVDRRELRDDRMAAFVRRVRPGVYQLTYTATAPIRGRFVARPAHVEEMYSPEVFGQSASDIVVVE